MKIRLPIRKPAVPRPPQRPPKLKLKASVASRRRGTPVIEDDDDEFLEEPEPNMKLSHAFVVVLVLHVIAVAGVFAFNSIKARQPAEVFAAPTNAEAAAPAPSANAPSPEAPANLAAAPATAAAATPQPLTSKPAPAPGRTHVLEQGETLSKVASRYGVSVGALMELNKITDPTKIPAGTALELPGGATSTAAPAVTAAASPAPAPLAAAPKPAATPAAPAPSAKEAPAATARTAGAVYVVEKGDNPVKIAKKLNVSYAALMEANGNPDPRKLQIGQKLKVPAK